MREITKHFPRGYKFASREELEEAYIEIQQVITEALFEIATLQDQRHRRNFLIKKLREENEKLRDLYNEVIPAHNNEFPNDYRTEI